MGSPHARIEAMPANTAVVKAVIGLHELRERASSPLPEISSPFAPEPYVLLRLDESGSAMSAEGVAACVRWLRRQRCPVIAIAPPAAYPPLQQACDVVLGDAAQAEPLLANVRRAPLAAMTLVQLLRATAHMSVEQGLLMESLAYATLQGGPDCRRWLDRQGAPHQRERRFHGDSGPAVLMERRGTHLDIRLNRPSRRNALSVEMRDALYAALEFVVVDASIATARISGNGPCFSSGGDLGEFGTAPDPATGHAVRSLRFPASVLLECVERVEFSVHGACVGAGVELPAFSRRVHARPDAYFQLPEIGFGLIPGAGGCISLPRRIGRQRTAYMALSAVRVGARRALEWGLVDSIAGA